MSKVRVEHVTKEDIAPLISATRAGNITEAESQSLAKCADCTTTVWVLKVDGELLCIWGLVPPTLLSDVAYVWVHTTEKVKDHEFIFVRQSQRAMQEMLAMYPRIVGHTAVGATRSIRWLKWLGAVYGEPDKGFIPFMVEAKTNG